MKTILLQQQKNNRAVAIWLLIGVAMMVVQILLGGITRLTGSGLSITEWNVVTGTLPPLNDSQWQAEFFKYQHTPQFRLLNSEFSLADFKFIFFWEWFHRLWARLIGVVFAVGFLYFFFTKKLKKEMVKPFLILFLLGALQGMVGWIMVASGLTGDAVYVRPTRLALHFLFALFLLSYTFWFALQLLTEKQYFNGNNFLRRLTLIIIIILGVQLLYGALMAGHKAAVVASTWPDINGDIIPANLYKKGEGVFNFIENKILIHFVHRGVAYILLLLVAIWTIKAARNKNITLLQKTKWIPISLIVLQMTLGIASLLTSTQIVANQWGAFEWMAQLHQLIGMLFLLSMVWMLFIIKKKNLQYNI